MVKFSNVFLLLSLKQNHLQNFCFKSLKMILVCTVLAVLTLGSEANSMMGKYFLILIRRKFKSIEDVKIADIVLEKMKKLY